MVPDPPQDEAPHARFRPHVVDERPVVRRELGQWHAPVLGNGELGRHGGGEVLFQGLRLEGLREEWQRQGRWLQP